MSLPEILDRLERMDQRLNDKNSSPDYRLYQMETMLDVLICHVKDAIGRDATPPPQHRRPA